MQFKSAIITSALILAPAALASEPLAARSTFASDYESKITSNAWTDAWWDQNTCNVNTQANTYSWAITVENAKAVDGGNCGASYMSKIKGACTGPYLAWSCRYVGPAQTTAWIEINADQSCTTAKVSGALGAANAAMSCASYADSFGAGVLEPMGSWRADIGWDFLSWW